MTKQQLFIYFLVGIMVFSVVGTGLLLLTSSDEESSINDLNSTDSNTDSSLPVNDGTGDDEERFLPDGPVTVLVVEDLVVGTGEAVVASDNITVHYTGWLASTGEVFDSSYSRGQPATFPLSGVITGWQEGIPGMQAGGKRRLVIPADQAYGPSGTGSIPPNSALVFEVELLEIVQ